MAQERQLLAWDRHKNVERLFCTVVSKRKMHNNNVKR
jgi:hypothetical protein